MPNTEKITMRGATLTELAIQWDVFEEGSIQSIENLKESVEHKIIESANESVSFSAPEILDGENVANEGIYDIPEDIYMEVFEEAAFRDLNVNEIAALVTEKHPQFESSNVYAVLHRIIATSGDFLVKPSPGNFKINFQSLQFPGTKKYFSRSLELKKYMESLHHTHTLLEDIFQLLESESSFILTEADRSMLTQELELLTAAVNGVKVYKMNNK